MQTITETPDLLNQSAFLWASDPMRIGKHEWRVIVYRDTMYGPCTQYEFRGPRAPFYKSEGAWCSAAHHWNTYNGDHCDGGMPKSLRRLYDLNAEKIGELIPRKETA